MSISRDDEQRLLDLLGLTATATADDVKRARKRLSRLYHTDRLGHESDEVKAHAARMMIQVNVACDALLKHMAERAAAEADQRVARRRAEEEQRRRADADQRQRAAEAEAERRAGEAHARAAHARAAKMAADERQREQQARRRRRQRMQAIVGGSLAVVVVAGLVVYRVGARRSDMARAVSFCCPHHVATSANGRYLVDRASGVVVDTSGDRLVSESDYNPHRLGLGALSADGHTGYSLFTPQTTMMDTSTLQVFDVDRGEVTQTLPLPRSGRVLALSAEARAICVPSVDGSTLALQVVDSVSGRLVAALAGPPAGAVVDVAVQPGGSSVYVLSTVDGAGTLTVFDVRERVMLGQVLVGLRPTGITFAPDGRLAYVVNAGSGSISIIDTVTRTPHGVIPVGQEPAEIAVGPSAIYVLRKDARAIDVVDLALTRVVRTVPLDRVPTGIGYGDASRKLYVFTPGEVLVLDPSTLQGVGTVAVPTPAAA